MSSRTTTRRDKRLREGEDPTTAGAAAATAAPPRGERLAKLASVIARLMPGSKHPLATVKGWKNATATGAWKSANDALGTPDEYSAVVSALHSILNAAIRLATEDFDPPRATADELATAFIEASVVVWFTASGFEWFALVGDPRDATSTRVKMIGVADMASMQQRHVPPPSLLTDDAARYAALLTLLNDPDDVGDAQEQHHGVPRVLVLWGPSGVGKTTAAIATALQLNAPAVVFMTPDPVWKKTPSADSTTRNATVREHFKGRLTTLFTPAELSVPRGEDAKKPCVIVLDEFGECPQVIRAITAIRSFIVADVRAILKLHDDTPVYIIAAGTGIEGESLSPGSWFKTFHLENVHPRVFQHFKDAIPPSVYDYVINPRTPTALHLHQLLLTNARCAAIFVTKAMRNLHVPRHSTIDTTVVATEGMMQAAAMLTVCRFCILNGLSDLSHPQIVHVLLQAMGTQFALSPLQGDLTRFKSKYGIVTDHGILVKPPTAAAPAPPVVEVPHRAPRNEVAPAFPAMLQIMLGLGRRPSSGEGFEQSFADFLALAIPMAAVTTFTEGDVAAMMQHCETEPPSGWSAPLSLVPWLRDAGCQDPMPAMVRQSANQLQSNTSMGTFKKCLSRTEEGAVVVINGGRAAFADLIVQCGEVVLLCQTKRYVSATLTLPMVLEELYKMGCRDPFVVAGNWAATATADEARQMAPALELPDRVRDLLGMNQDDTDSSPLPTSVPRRKIARHFSRKLFALSRDLQTPGDAKARAEAKARHSDFMANFHPTECDALAKVTNASVERGAKAPKVHFVVAVIGNAEPLPATAAHLLRNIGSMREGGAVQLLCAPLPPKRRDVSPAQRGTAAQPSAEQLSAGELEKEARRVLLAGYYPIRVSVEDPEDMAAVPKPVPPPPSG